MRRNSRASIALIAACLPLGVVAAAPTPATLMSKNLRQIPPQEIPAARVLHTILDGRVVCSHDSGR